MKKVLIALIGALCLFGCIAQNPERNSTIPFTVEMPLSALLSDTIIASEVTVLDEFTKDNSVVVYQGSQIGSFYSERMVRVDRVLQGKTELVEGSEIKVVGSVAYVNDKSFEVYGGAYEDRLMKGEILVLFVQYQPENDICGIYNIGHAAVNLSQPNSNDAFSIFLRLYFMTLRLINML